MSAYSIVRPDDASPNYRLWDTQREKPIVTIDGSLPNAFYLISACKMLMDANSAKPAEAIPDIPASVQ